MSTLRIQSILFHNEPKAVLSALDAIARAAALAVQRGVFSSVSVAYGDCSPDPVFGASARQELASRHPGLGVDYIHFGANLGSARGHNRLLESLDADLALVMNPDVILAPDTLLELAAAFADDRMGMVEARQLPIEHPKAYDLATGATSWAATACAMIPARICRELAGFDADSFFLYGDDVDFSWRVRLAGYKVIYRPSAAVFHDKRLGRGGRWMAGAAEQYYSAEAALLLSWKWSRDDLSERLLSVFSTSGNDVLATAAAAFNERRAQGRLPPQIDPEHTVAQFIDDAYAQHRFAIV